MYDALVPYGGLLNCGGGISVGVPVDDILGRLATLVGDLPGAVRHGRAAVAMARAMRSPPMLVQCLDHLADALAVAGDEEAEVVWAEAALLAHSVGVERAGRRQARAARDRSQAAVMRRGETGWEIASPLGAVRLPDSAGLRQLARLLSTPGVEVTAVELASGAGERVAADLGPALDAQAKRAYRQRLLELQAAVDDAAACNDPVRVGPAASIGSCVSPADLDRVVGSDAKSTRRGFRARVGCWRGRRLRRGHGTSATRPSGGPRGHSSPARRSRSRHWR